MNIFKNINKADVVMWLVFVFVIMLACYVSRYIPKKEQQQKTYIETIETSTVLELISYQTA